MVLIRGFKAKKQERNNIGKIAVVAMLIYCKIK